MASAADRYEYETRNGGEWGSVERTPEGYLVETHSRYQGTRTGERILIPADLVTWADGEDLSADQGPEPTIGARVALWLDDARATAGTRMTDRLVVLDAGIVVG